ncbi:D-alanyl-D-alanine carboxypeptidase family protein [Paenibacillus sp. y28]|uniref:D-alanyl-D-alanine carboxypeptidase family protein n=1 Tax=Paenibacillus sp. y28 TaxID=3129110 RepID=UPI0030198523
MQAAEPVKLELNVRSAILMEEKTGQIIYENNADAVYPPASMSKMMTEYLVMEAVKNGKISWEDTVTVDKEASEVIGSRVFLAENEKHTVKELFMAMAIGSANDASIALAKFLEPSQEDFAEKMNEKARELGLSSEAHFINATGLSRADMGKYAPKGIEGETVLSARDVATLALRVLQDHPEMLEVSKIPSFKFRERDKDPVVNINWMLEGNKSITNFKRYAYDGLDGLKTGHTNEAGYCFAGTAERNGLRFVSVVMGTSSEGKRFDETRKLLDYGFNNYEVKTLVAAGASVSTMPEVPILKGVHTSVPVVTEKALDFVVKKGTTAEVTFEPAAGDESARTAPLAKGAVVGKAKVSYNGMTQEVNLIAAEDAEKGSWLRLMFRGIKDFFVGLMGS